MRVEGKKYLKLKSITIFRARGFQNSKPHNVVKLTVVPCAPVVEVKIKRPDTKYQLGFSVQNGVVSTWRMKIVSSEMKDCAN